MFKLKLTLRCTDQELSVGYLVGLWLDWLIAMAESPSLVVFGYGGRPVGSAVISEWIIVEVFTVPKVSFAGTYKQEFIGRESV